MTDITIRPARATDREAIIDLVIELNRHEHALAGDRSLDRLDAIRRYEAFRAHDPRETAALYVAEREHAILGYAAMQIEERPDQFLPDHRRVAYLADICVSAAARGQGIGGALLRAAEGFARSHRAPLLGLTVLANNESALRTYRANGYEIYAYEMIRRL
jgi:ribosomal protein S18 acetylase RimI-like enzyme